MAEEDYDKGIAALDEKIMNCTEGEGTFSLYTQKIKMQEERIAALIAGHFYFPFSFVIGNSNPKVCVWAKRKSKKQKVVLSTALLAVRPGLTHSSMAWHLGYNDTNLDTVMVQPVMVQQVGCNNLREIKPVVHCWVLP